MTAEIAILNRSALALAADSAVTLTVGNKRKTYDTAEKLFEFSRSQPIALMIYNNVEYVGVPLDVLIRKYRSEDGGRAYSTIKEAADLFLEYLRTFEHDIFEEKRYLYMVVKEVLDGINKNFGLEMRGELAEFFRGGAKGKLPSPDEVLQRLIDERTEIEKQRPLSGYLSKVTLAAFRGRFADMLERAFQDTFKSAVVFNDSLRTSVENLGFRLMKSRKESNLVTGLVFGGFAGIDMFPTLRSIEIDGVYFDQVKIISTSEIDIDRKKTRAEVVPFAQKEMVERFMYGFDVEMQESIQKFVSTALDEVLTETAKGDAALRDRVKKKVNKNFSSMLGKLKESSRQDLLDIVYFMSKKELADIAYALVELTSHKRRFSTDEQTVGGPIDVAILTKSEGLVWIRRKHYFGPETNQGYYARNFGRGGSYESPKAAE